MQHPHLPLLSGLKTHPLKKFLSKNKQAVPFTIDEYSTGSFLG